MRSERLFGACPNVPETEKINNPPDASIGQTPCLVEAMCLIKLFESRERGWG